MRQSFVQMMGSLPDEEQVDIRRTILLYRTLGLGLPLAAFAWALVRHGLLATIDLLLHPATLFAGAAFYVLVPRVFGLMLTAAQAVHYWNTSRGLSGSDG